MSSSCALLVACCSGAPYTERQGPASSSSRGPGTHLAPEIARSRHAVKRNVENDEGGRPRSPRDGAFKATRGVSIAVVSPRERKRRQPRLATDDPAFVGWHQLVRGIQGPQVHLDLVRAASEDRRAAGTEKPPGVVACFAVDRHRILGEHRGRGKQCPMMLAAVETVTKADPVGESRRHNSDVAAQATARESVRDESPLKPSGRNVYNEPRGGGEALGRSKVISLPG